MIGSAFINGTEDQVAQETFQSGFEVVFYLEYATVDDSVSAGRPGKEYGVLRRRPRLLAARQQDHESEVKKQVSSWSPGAQEARHPRRAKPKRGATPNPCTQPLRRGLRWIGAFLGLFQLLIGPTAPFLVSIFGFPRCRLKPLLPFATHICLFPLPQPFGTPTMLQKVPLRWLFDLRLGRNPDFV